MWEALQRYRRLDRESQRLFWRAVRLLLLVRLSLRARGYKNTFSSLQERTKGLPSSAADSQRAELTCRMVLAAVRHSPLRFTCLEESLTLWYLLRRSGIASNLRIGVRKEHGKFEAHSWIELDGHALNQPEAQHRHYAAFEQEFAEAPAERP